MLLWMSSIRRFRVIYTTIRPDFQATLNFGTSYEEDFGRCKAKKNSESSIARNTAANQNMAHAFRVFASDVEEMVLSVGPIGK